MDVSDLIAIRIKELLKEKHISIYKLEQLTGICNSTLYMFLNRQTKTIRIENLVYVCDALKISIREFFDDKRFDNVSASEWRKDK